MKTLFYKKIISSTLILAIILPYFLIPREAKAIPVVDAPHTALSSTNLVETTVDTAANVANEVSTFSINYKEMVLDPLANGLAKMVVQRITDSIVEWINNGFNGAPSFVQNPGAFFLDIADQATGKFLTGGILSQLCSPFSIDLKIALSFKYHPRVQQRYACTLSTIIKNSINAGKNASINGFTAGDFKQGGWPAFVSLTTEPQNNVYGAYLQAESDLSFQVASEKAEQKDELGQGRGFLSWKKCKEVPVEGGDASTGEGITKKVCEVQTPGSVIAGSLDKHLGAGTDQLNLADELGEIVNALFAALVTKVISSTGLAGSSQRDSSGSSYITQMRTSLVAQESSMLRTQIAEIKKLIEPSIKNIKSYLENREKSFNLINGLMETFASSTACYNDKLSGSSTALTIYQTDVAQQRVVELYNAVTTPNINFIDYPDENYYVYKNSPYYGKSMSLRGIYSKVEDDYTKAVETNNKLVQIQQAMTGLVTLTELNNLATNMPQKITAIELKDASEDWRALRYNKEITIDLRTRANNFLSQCIAFPGNLAATTTTP